MEKKFLLAALILCFTQAIIFAQQLPPAFKDLPVAGTEKDPRVWLYLCPHRILWQSDHTGKYIMDAKNLLKPGNGQAELVNKDLVTLQRDATVKPGILFDFGKELHGGLQIVTGMMKENHPVKVRIRFDESASEAMSEIDTLLVPEGKIDIHAGYGAYSYKKTSS